MQYIIDDEYTSTDVKTTGKQNDLILIKTFSPDQLVNLIEKKAEHFPTILFSMSRRERDTANGLYFNLQSGQEYSWSTVSYRHLIKKPHIVCKANRQQCEKSQRYTIITLKNNIKIIK